MEDRNGILCWTGRIAEAVAKMLMRSMLRRRKKRKNPAEPDRRVSPYWVTTTEPMASGDGAGAQLRPRFHQQSNNAHATGLVRGSVAKSATLTCANFWNSSSTSSLTKAWRCCGHVPEHKSGRKMELGQMGTTNRQTDCLFERKAPPRPPAPDAFRSQSPALRNGALFFSAGGDEEKEAAKRKGRRAVLAQYQQQQDREACRDHKQQD